MLRDDIVIHMRHEMLVCSADDFLEHLAPFRPSEAWIERAFEHLEQEGQLRTPAKKTSIPTVPNDRKTKNSARAGASATPEARAAEPDVTTKDANSSRWKAYPDGGPPNMAGTEYQAFLPLESIVNKLLECPDLEPNERQKRKPNGYRYLNCPDNKMKSERTGANFRVDAVIRNGDIYKEDGIGLAAAQTAVPIEFKKRADPATVFENRKQLVSAANHIMNDDPRRNWMYGITIENTNLSLWYFSRSYSMKSEPFNFTTDLDKFIRIFLSFLYADDKELGHDTTIHRMKYNGEWCCVFEMEVTNDVKYYYRTIQSLYNPRSLCITGRSSRVWKVVQVHSPSDLERMPNAPEVVLKDCWVDVNTRLEKKIQEEIVGRLKTIEEAEYAWAPQGLRDRLKHALAHPYTYFMKINLDCAVGSNKGKPEFQPDPLLLSDPIESSLAVNTVIPSTQTPSSTGHPSSHPSRVLSPAGAFRNRKQRQYQVKRHYRVIYDEVGKSLANTNCLSDAVRAFEDIFIALTVLFLAGWVHRDVSDGNIILVHGSDGVRAKLSDLEYARPFGSKGVAISTDPKTGTPYFMPLEIHTGSFLIAPSSPENLDLSSMKLESWRKNAITSASPPALRYIFAHDLESLWWIMVWIIVMRIKGGPSLELELLFVVLDYPHGDRSQFFTKGKQLLNHLNGLINDALCDRHADSFLSLYNSVLLNFYQSGNREQVANYQEIYKAVWNALEQFISIMSDVNMELEDPHLRRLPPPKRLPADADVRKRARSVGVSDKETSGGNGEDGRSRKKSKSKADGVVFSDTTEKEFAEDDTAGDDSTEDDAAEDDAAEAYTVEDDSGEDYQLDDDAAEDDSDTD